MSINRIVIVGNLGRDPQTFGNGDDTTKVTRLSIATDRVWRDADGNRQEATDWHPVVAFGPLAELAAKLEKGDPVAIEGRGQTRRFEQDGETVYAYEIVARTVTPPSRLGRQVKSDGEAGVAAGAEGR